MKLYQYTILKMDGTKEALPPSKIKEFRELYKILNCTIIQLIPSDYWKGMGHGRCSMFGDEEGRFNDKNIPNPHFRELAPGYNVVGDIIKKEVYKGENKKF